MSDTQPIEDVIRHVAEGLGLVFKSGLIRMPDGGENNKIDALDVIFFASYAEAEMAKRGWETSAGGHYQEDGSDVVYSEAQCDCCVNGVWKHTQAVRYNPADPIAKAHAVLRCVAEALEINSKQQPGDGREGD